MGTDLRRLGDQFTLRRGTTYQSSRLGEPGPVLLGLASIQRNGGFRRDSLRTYGGDSPEALLVRPGELYVSLKDVTQSADLLGAVARLPRDHPIGRLTQDTVRLDPKLHTVPVDYIYWLLRTPEYRDYCRAHATGTTNLGLPRDDFLAFPIPELTAERRLIIEALEGVDEKIELNRRTSETLEAIVRTLFNSWFVHFDPVRAKAEGRDPRLPRPIAELFPDHFDESESGETPAGWRGGTLAEVAEHPRRGVQPDQIHAGTPYIALEHVPKRSIALAQWATADGVGSGKLRFARGEILFGKLRPYFHKVGVAPVDGVCSTDIVVVRPRSDEWFGLVLGTVSSDAFVEFTNAGSTGTKMPRTSWSEMERYPLAIPSSALARAFSDTVRPSVDRIIASIHESRTLATVRDALLPKLISGEIRVPQAERMLEAAPV